MNNINHPTIKINITNSDDTLCQCRKCNTVFKHEERGKKPISFGMTQDVCPKCGGSYTVIKWKNGMKSIGDKYLNLNPNDDPKAFNV